MIARYETNDLHLAATLQCLGLELLEVRPAGGKGMDAASYLRGHDPINLS